MASTTTPPGRQQKREGERRRREQTVHAEQPKQFESRPAGLLLQSRRQLGGHVSGWRLAAGEPAPHVHQHRSTKREPIPGFRPSRPVLRWDRFLPLAESIEDARGLPPPANASGANHRMDHAHRGIQRAE